MKRLISTLMIVLLLGVQMLTGMSWRGWFQSVPDLSIVLLTIAGLWLVTAIVRIWRIVRPAWTRDLGTREVPGTVAPAR